MNNQGASSGSYLEAEEQQHFTYNYRDYPKDPPPTIDVQQSVFSYNYRDYPPRHRNLNLSESVEEELDQDRTISTQDTCSDKNIIDVYLRIKPSKNKSNPCQENVLHVRDSNSIVFKPPKDFKGNLADTSKVYKFSNIYGSQVNQSEMFKNVVLNMLEKYLLDGEDALLFSFGTTNSGKTYTIQGTPENPGIIPRTLNILFKSLTDHLDPSTEKIYRPTFAAHVTLLAEEDYAKNKATKAKIMSSFDLDPDMVMATMSSYHTADDESSRMFKSLDREHTAVSLKNFHNCSVSLWISFYEVYNECVYDLLDTTNLMPPAYRKKTILKIGRDKNQNVYIKDLIYIKVDNCEEAYKVLRFGMGNLSVASTELNNKSSRSHCVFSIKLVKMDSTTDELLQVSSFEICDLAGAERQKKAHTSGARLKEARTINTSLHMLARCFQMLRENSGLPKEKKQRVPYRDSKLTQIFQRSLQGANPVKMIVNVNTSPNYAEETLQVLKISSVAREVLTVKKPPRLVLTRPNKSRFSIMASQNLNWHDPELLGFGQNTGCYNPFQSTIEEEPSFETVNNLHARIEELLLENEDLKETKVGMMEILETMKRDRTEERKDAAELHKRELASQESYLRGQLEFFKTRALEYKAIVDEMYDEEEDDHSSAENKQKVTICNLRQEVKDFKAQYENITEQRDALLTKVADLTKQNTELETRYIDKDDKHKELEFTVAQLRGKLEVLENKQRLSSNSAQVKYLSGLLDEAKQEFTEQATEIDNLRFELDEANEENGRLTVRIGELEEDVVNRNDWLAMKDDQIEELQEKLDDMENKFQRLTIELEHEMSEKEKVISELRSQLASHDNSDEIVLQKEIKTLSSLLVAKDKTIAELQAKRVKFEQNYLILREDRKNKEKELGVLRPKCEDLEQKVTKLEGDCGMYMNTINQMENDEQSTKKNNEQLLKIYEDRLKAAQEELSQLKTSQIATPGVTNLQAKLKSLEQELTQRNNMVRDLQLSLLEKTEKINKLKEQLERGDPQRFPLQGLENKMSHVSLFSPELEDDQDEDPDFMPRKCNSTAKKRQAKKKEATSLNKTTEVTKQAPVATPRRKLFNNSNTPEGMKTPRDMSPVTTFVPSPKSQIKNKLRTRKK